MKKVLGGRSQQLAVLFGLVLLAAGAAVWKLPWLVEWSTQKAGSQPASSRGGLLVEVTDAAGIDFVHRARASDPYFFPNIMGSGCALLDFDQDGDLDVFLVNGGVEPEGRPDIAGSNRLYRQDSPGRFVDVTAGSGLESTAFGMGVAAGDVNNDGLPDLYVTNYGPDRLYLNQGEGRFQDVTEQSGIDNPRWGASACFLDYDRDGWLDLYVTNYVDYYPSKICQDARGQTDFCGPQVFFGTADKLYRNVAGRSRTQEKAERTDVPIPRFADESLSSGIAAQSGPGLGVLSADFDGDGWQDIYVANDGTPNWLWMNQRDGTFVDEAVLRGCATDVLGRSQAGMGLALGDTDGDGLDELFVTHLDGEMNALYRIRGGLQFEEESLKAGLGEPSIPYTGFGTAMLDLEHDGDLDILVVNGRVKRPASGAVLRVKAGAADPRFWEPYAEPNQLFLNERGKFRIAGPDTEPFSAAAEVSRGLAAGDVDNDGDVDVLITNAAGNARLFLNASEKRGSWLVVRAIDPALGGRDACGAVISVTAGGHTWRRHVNPAFSYLSSSDPRVHFGLGSVERIERIDVRWPDGSTESFPSGHVNELRVLRHGEGDRTDRS